jgi:tetratricopeptide (TPR) repeat protein
MRDIKFKNTCRLLLAVCVGIALQAPSLSPALAKGPGAMCMTHAKAKYVKRVPVKTKTGVLYNMGTPVVPVRPVLQNRTVIRKAIVTAAPMPVNFAGVEVFSIPTPAGGFTAEERSMIVERNLNNALYALHCRTPNAVKIEIVNSLPVIRLGDKHIVTIDTLLADAYHTDPLSLGEKWVCNMQAVLCDTEKVQNYVANLDGNFLLHPYSRPAWRERWQAARLNHAAESYRKDVPADLMSSKSFKNDGFQFLMHHEPCAAELCFRNALIADPENERARYGLGVALLKQGLVEHALMNFQMAHSMEPNDAQVLTAMGETLETMGHDNEAISNYQMASRLQPENPEPALYVADLREERDQISTSQTELNLAMLGAPDSDYLRLRKKDQLLWRLTKPY